MKRKRYSTEQIAAAIKKLVADLSLADAKDKIAAWLKDYNESRPHRALNDLAPLEYVAQLGASISSWPEAEFHGLGKWFSKVPRSGTPVRRRSRHK